MTKFKPALLVVFCVTLVASEPLNYETNNIDIISPRSPVKPSNYKLGYNPASASNQQLSAPIHSPPSLPPPTQLLSSEAFPLASSTATPPSQKPSSPPFKPRLDYLATPTATPSPPPFRIEVFEPSHYAFPPPPRAEYNELAYLPPGPLPEQQYIETGAPPPFSQPFIHPYSPFQQYSQTSTGPLPPPSLPPREPPFAALPATPRPRDCAQQRGDFLITEKSAYPVPAQIELPDNDAILVEAYPPPSASPAPSPQPVYPKAPSSLPPLPRPHPAPLQKKYPAFPSPPSSPPQPKYPAFSSPSIPPPPPTQYLPAGESECIAYDVFSAFPSPSPSPAHPNYPAFSSPSIPPPPPYPQPIYPAFPSPSSPPQPQYQAFTYPSFSPPPTPPPPQSLPAQESDCVAYDYPRSPYQLPFKPFSHN